MAAGVDGGQTCTSDTETPVLPNTGCRGEEWIREGFLLGRSVAKLPWLWREGAVLVLVGQGQEQAFSPFTSSALGPTLPWAEPHG